LWVLQINTAARSSIHIFAGGDIYCTVDLLWLAAAAAALALAMGYVAERNRRDGKKKKKKRGGRNHLIFTQAEI